MKTLSLLLLVFTLSYCTAQQPQAILSSIQLPKPDTAGGKPLMQALKERKTSRSFSDSALSQQVVSNLVWAAFGINRPDGHRTAPSAKNWQEMEVYLAMKDGLYLYDSDTHSLGLVLKEDLREKTGTQPFVKDAPLNIIYVADLSKAKGTSDELQNLFVGADCGFIAQNVYLYCASEGLACVVRGSFDKNALGKAIGLRADQKVVLTQTVGYPK